MNRRILIPILIFCAVVLAVLAVSALSLEPGAVQGVGSDLPYESVKDTLVTGNYCVSCHLADDPRLDSVKDWRGSIAREVNSPCPAATKIREELYYTERLLLMIDRAEEAAGVLPDSAKSRLDGYTQRYSRILDVPVTSLDAFVNEAQTTRYQLNKIYTVLNEMVEAAKVRTVLLYAAAATLVVLGSLGWGLYNTRAVRAGILSKSRAAFWRVLFVSAVLVFFALPIFRVPAVEMAMTTSEQQEAQTILDTAQRAADAADRAQGRAWMLARIGSAWSALSTTQAQDLLDESVAALKTAAENDKALWGQSLVVQEVTVGIPIEMESAGLIAEELNAARGRSWALPLVAVEWRTQDPEKAASLLRQEQESLANQAGLYRDLQLRSLALAWADVDPAQAVPLTEQMDDPSLRAWTLRELAVLIQEPLLFDLAAEYARTIMDPIQRAGALREIAVASGQSALYAEALVALEETGGIPLVYALSDLVAASGDDELVEQIDPAYPDARSSALLRMGRYEAAWEAASLIVDPYERARAQAAIAGAWGNGEAASQITVKIYRDLALRDVIRKTGNAALVDTISSAYYKVQAWMAAGELEPAIELASSLGDTYPLVELAVRLAETDPDTALAVVEGMTREVDKAIALRAIAAASQDSSLFEQARGMALASRVRGDSLAPAQALLNLAEAMWDVNPANAQAALSEAFEAALRIAIK